MPNHPGHPALASSQELITGPGRISSALDAISVQTVTSSGYIRPRDGRYIIVQPSESITLTLPDPDSDPAFQNIRIVLKRTTGGLSTVTVVAGGTSTIDGDPSFTLDAQYDCEVLFSSSTTGQWHRMRKAPNLLAPDYLDFGDWIVGTDDSNPAPTATSDQYVAPDGTTTADKIEWDNSTELADESWAEPGAASIEAGDTAQYSFYIDSEVGDGVKTVLEVGDSSVPQITEQATVAFSNVFAEDHYIAQSISQAVSGAASSVAVADPDGGSTALRHTGWTASTIEVQPSPSFSLDAGQEYTWTFYVLAETDSRTHSPLLRITGGSGTTNSVSCRFTLSTGSGVSIVTFASSSAGPAYTSSNAFRSEQVDGTDWWKISLRVADYGGDLTFLRPFHYFYDSLNAQDSFASWKWELRYGNHITGQQLLTVDDGVENLLNSTGVFAVSDYPSQTRVSSTGIAAIAAPDGTLTGDSIVGDTTGTAVCFYSMTPSTAGLGWQDGLAVSFSIYVYRPNMTGATGDYARFQLSLLGTAGYNNYIQWRCRANDEVFLFTAATPSSCSFTYTQERNLSYEEIGNTGWIKYTAVLWDFDRNMTSLQLSAERLGGDYELITWNPTLRYGDWVSRGKNKADSSLTDLLAYPSGSQAPSWSSFLAPDGTASAVDLWGSSGGYYPQRTMMPSSEYVTGGRYTAEFYIKHPLPSRADIVNYGVRVELIVSAGTSEVIRPILARNGGIVSVVTGATAGPGYTLDDTESLQITDDGWWRYRVYAQHYDTANPITNSFFWWLLYDDTDEPVTIWNPRLTVGNPADARGYFVSGPQNLLGDGSDYDPATSNWGTGAAPRDVAVTTNTAVAPNGRLEADTLTHTDGQSPNDYLTISISKSAATEAVYYNFYYKIDTALPTGTACERIFFRLLAGATQVESINAYLAYGSDDPVISVTGTTTGGPGYTADDITVTAISNDWVRVSIRLFDYSGTADNPRVLHYNQTPLGTGVDYDVTLWGSEITTIDRTPTATDLRPISGGIVNYDAYPAEHRSLFASYEDAGDNWYKVTMNLTEPN